MRKPSKSRKLLIASVGVATINYVAACGGEATTSGNLVAPQAGSESGGSAGVAGDEAKGGSGKGGTPTSGNLVAPPAGASNGGSGGTPTSGNLVAPPAGAGGKAGAGGNAGAPTSGNLVPPPAGNSGQEGQ